MPIGQRKKQQPLAAEVLSSAQGDSLQTPNSEPEPVKESQSFRAHESGNCLHDEFASTELELLPKSPGPSNTDPFGMFLGGNWMLAGLDNLTTTTGPSSASLDAGREDNQAPPINNGGFGDLAFDPINFAILPGSSSSSSSSPPGSLGSETANIAGSDSFSFPDTYLLPVPELTLVRALLRIADRLGCTSTIWDIKTLSPFNGPGGCESAGRLLPETWRPTPTQAKVLHHPVLDLVPWPSARDRLISIFSLPESMRPPSAAGPLGLIHFVCQSLSAILFAPFICHVR